MEKNYIWSLTLELVHDFGLDLTRNDETKAHISACDAMAEGLTVCGRDTGYSEIKNLMVHSDHSRRRKEFEVARRLYFRSNERQGPENALHPDYFDYWAKAASEDVLDIMGTFPTDG